MDAARFMYVIACAGIAMGLVSSAALAAPQVILEENFDSYEDHAAFEQVWTKQGDPVYVLDTTFGDGGNSLKLATVGTGDGSTNRFTYDLGATYNGTDDKPLVFSYDLYVNTYGTSTDWQTAWHTCGIRGYDGGGYKQGDLRDLVAFGLANWPDQDLSHYQGRIYHDGAELAGTPEGYINLDAPTAPTRSLGWHSLMVEVRSSSLTFYVDGSLAELVPVGLGGGIDCMVLGNGVFNAHNGWVDNVRVEIVPEPSVLCLLGLGALVMGWRRRCSGK